MAVQGDADLKDDCECNRDVSTTTLRNSPVFCEIQKMHFRELDQRVMKLISAGQFDIAEEELRQARLRASKETDPHALENVLSSLVMLYLSMEPPDFMKAESCCLELEQISGYWVRETANRDDALLVNGQSQPNRNEGA